MKKQAKRQKTAKRTNHVGVDMQESLALKFLDKIKSFPLHLTETLLKTLSEEALQSSLKAVRNIIMKLTSSKTLISENLVLFLKTILDRAEPPRYQPKVLAYACNIMKICTLLYLDQMRNFGVEKTLIKILKADSEAGSESGTSESQDVVRLLAEFFPALPRSRRNENTERMFFGVVFAGREAQADAGSDAGLLSSLKAVYRPLVDICLKGGCSLGCGVLLTKVVYWAMRAERPKFAAKACDQLRLIEVLSKDDDWQRNVFGMWIAFEMVKQLLSKKTHRARVLGSLRTARNRMTLLARINFQGFQWMTNLYALFDPDNPLLDDRVVVESLLDEIRSGARNFFKDKETVRSVIEFLTPFHSFDLDELTDFHYARMTTFLEVVLNLPKDARRGKERPNVNQMGVETFGRLVSFVVEVISGYLHYDDYAKGIVALFPHESLLAGVPKSPREVRLNLSRAEALDRCLCHDEYLTEEQRENPHSQALRLISVLHSVNENWGVLFCTLPAGTLVERERFISASLDEKITTYLANGKDFDAYILSLTMSYGVHQYPFLLKFGTRAVVFDILKSYFFHGQDILDNPLEFIVPRKGLVEHVTKNSDLYADIFRPWRFRFRGEEGRGMGPTKEFYSLFSTDCQRFELGLWIGERLPSSDGSVDYVHNPAGLFPLPLALTSRGSAFAMRAIAKVVFNSISNDVKMDLSLSPAFYKALLSDEEDCQFLTLFDVKDVLPSIAGFVGDLVEALRQKWNVEEDNSLTAKQKKEALSRITCDGCPFEDLCVDFTLPGFPELEMKQGGRNDTLQVGNLEEYLKLLVWTLLYDGVQASISRFRIQFCETFRKGMFLPHEFDRLLCGERAGQWTVEELERSCRLEGGYAVDTPVIRHLYEVLTSLTTAEQSRFLQFVTGAPRLPVGGLDSLQPKLTVKRSCCDLDPDSVLPTCMTCFNVLFLGEYSSKEVLRSKLLLAINEGANSFGFI